MPDTKRQQIIDAVRASLSDIKTINGYKSNLGNNVFEWKVAAVSELNLPAIICKDISNTRADGAIGRFTWSLAVELQILASGETVASDMRNYISDVYRAIGADYTWGGLAINTEQPSDEMDIEHLERKIASAVIRFTVLYDTTAWEM